ncbi:hypothetical protein BHE74_00027595 [Ensete ventricosum]|nr:hypothetical protein GW17_00011567 [Ensete ventricosum]RWW65122.1 hypothetical protein BHE74_00027595 [Ensete ventricosum]RZR76991.1 hypothetical protein BHM03_00001922 [Ensete ventricosum]
MHCPTLLQVLKVFQFPLTITLLQFSIGTFLVLFMWTTNLYKRPKISPLQVSSCDAYLNIYEQLAHRCDSLLYINNLLLDWMQTPTIWVVLSLMPIVGGVALASLTEASFNW